MIGFLVLTHGNLARELVAAAEVISGRPAPCDALALDWRDGLEAAQRKVGAAIGRLDRGDGVLVLTDMIGDTPYNAARTFLANNRVEIVTGVNLPMVVRLSCLRAAPGETLADVAAWIRSKGQNAICRAADLAAPSSAPADDDCRSAADEPLAPAPAKAER